jgi:hypothetical protein
MRKINRIVIAANIGKAYNISLGNRVNACRLRSYSLEEVPGLSFLLLFIHV